MRDILAAKLAAYEHILKIHAAKPRFSQATASDFEAELTGIRDDAQAALDATEQLAEATVAKKKAKPAQES